MTFQGALIREQNVTFAVVVVKQQVTTQPTRAQECAAAYGKYFPGKPVVLMSQDARGRATYWGRRDIVRFLATVQLERIPWREYSVN